jgi:hypothetical protein
MIVKTGVINGRWAMNFVGLGTIINPCVRVVYNRGGEVICDTENNSHMLVTTASHIVLPLTK